MICAACGTPVDELAGEGRRANQDHPSDPGAPAQPVAHGGQTFLVVARGHSDLLDQLKEVVGDLGWVRLVEDRRDDPTILPREGREGSVHIDPDTP
ncbi:MAG: hypothetical protein HY002_09690 [Candidatus Rokubacteria bacterium]|nr:hypothetical protein [Candidatus Rokubacteria bacterium]